MTPSAAAPHPIWSTNVATALVLCAFTLAVLIFRRPDQFLNPGIWVEDGTVILPAYADRGWTSLLDPVAGYSILSSKLIAFTAFKTAIRYAPDIMVGLTAMFTMFVVSAVALSPTYLKWPALCAVAVLLVPTDGEVFAVSELSFWWAGLLLFLVLVWRSEAHLLWRLSFLVLGGLSSPAILPVAGLLVLRALIQRSRFEALIAVVAVGLAAFQASSILMNASLYGTEKPSFDSILVGAMKLGVPVLILLIAIMLDRKQTFLALLGAAALALCAMTLARMDISQAHPLMAGPRYFFYPYIVGGWLIIAVAAESGAAVKVTLLVMLAAVVLYATTFSNGDTSLGFSRRHAFLDWREALRDCGKRPLPIQYDGSAERQWHVNLTPDQCRSLLAGSLF